MSQRTSAAMLFILASAACLVGPAPARAQEIDKLFTDFLNKPAKASYLKVFDALVSSDKYDPYSDDLEEAFELVEKKEFQKARAKLDASMPNLLLSPRAHLVASLAAQGLGDTKQAKRQDDVAKKCIEGILSTGNGKGPGGAFLVTRPSDEYDVLRNHKKELAFQSLRIVKPEQSGEAETKYYDVFRCTDDTEIWFNVTMAYKALERRIRRGKPKE